MTEVEDYGRQIFEAISYANEFPVVKEKLLIMFDKLIEELSELIDEDELNDYKKAKKVVEKIPENEVEELCFTVESLYGDVLKNFKLSSNFFQKGGLGDTTKNKNIRLKRTKIKLEILGFVSER